MHWRESDGVRWLEARLPGARAAFTTRHGGVSEPPFDELNLGLLTGDEPAAVRRNRELASAALGLEPAAFAIGRQVHGSRTAVHEARQDPSPWAEPGSVDPPEVDAHSTARADLALLVFVADCLPIAVAGAQGVAMLHGGWRPLAGGIVERGLEGIEPHAAAIGPGIGKCCFEVGPEVVDAFAPLGPDVATGRMLDLTEVARRLLSRAGVEEVESAELCTRCNADLFFSHRGEGPRTGRQAGVVSRTV